MRVPTDTMCVSHTFDVVKQAKVAAVIRLGDVEPVCRHLVYGSSDPEPWTYLHLRGGVGVLLRLLISPAALRLGVRGVIANSWHQGAACGGRGRYCGEIPPGRTTSSVRKSPIAKALCRFLKFGHRTLCHLSNARRKLSLNSCCIRRRRAVGKVGFWQACACILGMTPDVYSRRRNIL